VGRPKRRRLGQNFLTDPRVAERIVALLRDEPPRVLEIGPGRGALTAPLLDRFDRVLALELDPDLVPSLRERFPGGALQLLVADALREPLEPILAREAPWQVASNLPYSVGTAILRRLLPRHDLFGRLAVMLQREVAERVMARPGQKGHGLLALERASWADARLAFEVGPEAFRPRPRIFSTVMVLDLHPPQIAAPALRGALSLAAHALTRPRKMLANAIRPLASADQLRAAGLDPAARPGTVSLEGWSALARAVRPDDQPE
jgi:16S rRNA (adenine1518-N6/adenine1519-N6)-dimethyltransferase